MTIEYTCNVMTNTCFFRGNITGLKFLDCSINLMNGDEIDHISCSDNMCIDTEIHFHVFTKEINDKIIIKCSENHKVIFEKSFPVSIDKKVAAIVTNTSYDVNKNLKIHYRIIKNVDKLPILYVANYADRLQQVTKVYCGSYCVVPSDVIKAPGIYRATILFYNNNTYLKLSTNLTLFNLDIKSQKKQYLRYSTGIFDALYNVSFDTQFSPVAGLIYVYHYQIDQMNFTTSRKIFSFKFPLIKKCYNISVSITSMYLWTAIDKKIICMDVGMNVTFQVNDVQKFKTPSTFLINIPFLGTDSCIFLDTNDSSTGIFAIYKDETENIG